MNIEIQTRHLRTHYSWLLKTGAHIGAGLLLAGLTLKVAGFRSSESKIPDASSLSVLTPPWEKLLDVFRFDPEALQYLGILVLIITPVVRVLWSFGLYLKDRDRPMALFAFISLLFMGLGAIAKL